MEVWDARTGDDYTRGLLDGVERFAYSSSEPWAENGVRYVGISGKTLFDAQKEILRERDYQLPEPYALDEVLT